MNEIKLNKKIINRKGIILAGGTGSRLYPLTKVVSKQLLPVYDKPMIYYPLSTLMLAGIKDFLVITTPQDHKSFKNLLSDGNQWGISIDLKIQENPNGIAEAFLIGEDFLNNSPSALILGDNLFYGNELIEILKKNNNINNGSTVFSYPVSNPKDYAIAEFAYNGDIISIEEKPKSPKSQYAITGIYFFDSTIVSRAKKVIPSKRGELEITEILKDYLKTKELNIEQLGRGMAWLDTGTCDSLNEASLFVKTIETRQGLKIGCPEEVAYRMGYITGKQLEELAKPLLKSGYGEYLKKILNENVSDFVALQKNLNDKKKPII